jgi:cysteinyl-tRNA synthetase
MNCKQLGNHFDIHGGGSDLMFPHHENEIAQSTCAHDGEYVNYWMHSGMVMVDREKMSKSLGNFFTVRDVLKFYDAETIRYFLMSGHYRSQLNYSEENLNRRVPRWSVCIPRCAEPIKRRAGRRRGV